jgi:hypothetical protein
VIGDSKWIRLCSDKDARLMSELAKGQKSGEEKEWPSHEDVRACFKQKLSSKNNE